MTALRILFLLAVSVSIGGCVTTAQTTEETKTAQNYGHAKLYVNMPYEKSVEAITAWVNRCYPGGEFTGTVPFLVDSGMGYFVTPEEALTRIQVLPIKTKIGLPNAFTTAGGVIVNAELTADGNGTNIAVDAWRGADGWAKRLSKLIIEGGLTSCWK